MSHNLNAVMSRVMSKAVRQGFSFEYFPPDNPGDLPVWAVRTTREGRRVPEVHSNLLGSAYERWAGLNGLPTEPE